MKGVESVSVAELEAPFDTSDEAKNGLLQEAADDNVENSSKNEAAPRAPEYEEKLDILSAHYGTQYFKYGPHEGDFAKMIDLCGAIRIVIKQQSVEDIITLLDAHMIETPVLENKSDDEVDAEPEAEKLNDPSKDNKVDAEPKKPIVAEVARKPEPKKAKVIDAPVTVDMDIVTPLVVAAALVQQKDIELVESVDTYEVANEAVVEVANPKKIVEEIAPQEIEIVEPQDTPHTPDVPVKIQKTEAKTPIQESAEATEIVTEQEALHVNIELADFIETEEVGETQNFDIEESSIETAEPEKLERGVVETFDTWQELAEKNVSLDTFLVAMVEELSSQIEEIAEVKEVLSEENIELPTNVSPELESMLIEVTVIKSAIERLQRATTKEECSTEVEQIISRMTDLLRILGYENPEKIIRDFLYAHPLNSLYELIEALEQSLQRKIQQEAVRSQQKGNVHKRHLSFGRFVLYMMQTLSHRNTAFDLSI